MECHSVQRSLGTLHMTTHIPSLRKFVAPEFIFGEGSLSPAGRFAKNLGARKVLVVSDAGVIAAGWADKVISCLSAQLLPYTLFASVTSNPRSDEVMLGAQAYRSEECNMIVAVGGGSAMDCAKGIGIVNSNGRHIRSEPNTYCSSMTNWR
jgi:alcohol dehydrogenase